MNDPVSPPPPNDAIPCAGHEPHCVVEGNPETWPVIGGLVTDITDALGLMNGWYGFGVLVIGLVGGTYFLTKTKEGKSVLAKAKRIIKY